jgi:hypothetical protein
MNASEPKVLNSPSRGTAPSFAFNPGDPANNVNYPVAGWPTLAQIIAQKPDLEAFPSFKDLSIKSLLYYQAELISLRKELHKVEWADFRISNEDSSSFAENLSHLISARNKAIRNKEDPPQQWIIIEKIRNTLEKYS